MSCISLAGLFSNTAFAQVPDSDCVNAAGNVTVIESVPYSISQPGVYCLAKSVSYITTSNSSTWAITIAADNVTLDLNSHSITGRLAGGVPDPAPATMESGVYIHGGSRDVTVKNGTITGMAGGISISTSFDGTPQTGVIIEDMHITDMNGYGISAYPWGCNHCVIRNNDISRVFTGITVTRGDGLQVTNNTITGVSAVTNTVTYGITVSNATNVQIEDNHIVGGPVDGNNAGISATSSTNVLMANNHVSKMNRGYWYFYSTGDYAGNMTSGVNIPYTGGTAHGVNF